MLNILHTVQYGQIVCYYFSIFVLELIVFRAVEANTLLKYTHWSVARTGAKLQMQHASLGSTKCENVFDHTAQLCTYNKARGTLRRKGKL
jgi:hypothetical protein